MRGYYKQHYVNKFENTYKMGSENCQNLLEKKEYFHGTTTFNKNQTAVTNIP